MAAKPTLPAGNGVLREMRTAQSPDVSMATVPKRRKPRPRAKKVDDEGLVASLCTLICEHQIGRLWNELDPG